MSCSVPSVFTRSKKVQGRATDKLVMAKYFGMFQWFLTEDQDFFLIPQKR